MNLTRKFQARSNNMIEWRSIVYKSSTLVKYEVEKTKGGCTLIKLYIRAANRYEIKIILHRIISVVDLTSFLPETWTRTNHDEESWRLPLSVKRSIDGLDLSRPVYRYWGSFPVFFTDDREEEVVFWVVVFLKPKINFINVWHHDNWNAWR